MVDQNSWDLDFVGFPGGSAERTQTEANSLGRAVLNARISRSCGFRRNPTNSNEIRRNPHDPLKGILNFPIAELCQNLIIKIDLK